MGLRERRERAISELYGALESIGCPSGGPVPLGECQPATESAGVYFFFEPGEERASGGPRIVRVGESRNVGYRLLVNHLKGIHRDDRWGPKGLLSSRFRRDIGEAVMRRDGLVCRTWMDQNDPSAEDVMAERLLEDRVTSVISAMPVTWVPVTGTREARRDLERRLIGLFSNWDRDPVDPPSKSWLGTYHPSPIVQSGLWNTKHTDTHWLEGSDCAERLAAARG